MSESLPRGRTKQLGRVFDEVPLSGRSVRGGRSIWLALAHFAHVLRIACMCKSCDIVEIASPVYVTAVAQALTSILSGASEGCAVILRMIRGHPGHLSFWAERSIRKLGEGHAWVVVTTGQGRTTGLISNHSPPTGGPAIRSVHSQRHTRT